MIDFLSHYYRAGTQEEQAMNLAIKSGAAVAPGLVRELFVRNQWCDWMKEEDIAWYLAHSHCVVTAWDGASLIGIAVLVGDGRKYLELENLLVDEARRHRGIGKALMAEVMRAIAEAKPYAAKIEVFEEATEAFYREFGFVRNHGTWLLELAPGSDALRVLTRTPRKP
ncbi:MAG: GNAT family N-acetyltransferase [Candidatus Hydrogenedentes bacterium]|nr:GNAT family N-acetyltransferase [Candidatus Hydrogenedentota bacterium]